VVLLLRVGSLALVHDGKGHGADEGDATGRSEDGVGNGAGLAVGGGPRGQLEAEAAVDDAESDEDAAIPDVDGGPDRGALGGDVLAVVNVAKDGLEDESGNDDRAEDGVRVVVKLER
jgi:hypothetical protein